MAAPRLDVPPITLGTVQLGMPYGLGQARDGIGEPAAQAIFDEAWTRGIRCIDTARVYGEAERRIGRWLAARDGALRPLVVSKFPALSPSDRPGAVEQALEQSRRDLGLDRIDIYLAHRGSDLLRPGVVDVLRACVARGEIGAFGASLYAPEDAALVLEIPDIAALQLPLHLANTAAADSGLLESAARRGIAIFARSIFLQGLLLRDPRALDPFFAGAAVVLDRLDRLARAAETTRAALALAAVRALPGVSSIVVGVDSASQLGETLAAFAAPVDRAAITAALQIGRSLPPELADPRRWNF